MMVERLEASGLAARAAIADSWGATHALARYTAARPILVMLPGGAAEIIGPLPLPTLHLSPPMVAELRTLGFTRTADIMATPHAPLALRFGLEIMRRLDQALGRAAEAIDLIRPAALIEVHRQFPEPIAAAETIAHYIGKLVVQLRAGLEAKGLGARRLDLICHRVDLYS
jgi:protein ImuB